jgi:hypothetical protein
VSKWGKGFWADFGERVGSSAVVVAIPDVVAWQAGTLDLANAAKLLVGTVLLTALKCVGANFKSPESGASLLSPPPGPVVVDTPAPHVDYPGGNP